MLRACPKGLLKGPEVAKSCLWPLQQLWQACPQSLLQGGQMWMIVRVQRKVEGLRKITNLRQAITWWSGWAKGLPIGRSVIGARSQGIKMVVETGERGQAKTTLNELQDRTMFVQLPRDIPPPGIR